MAMNYGPTREEWEYRKMKEMYYREAYCDTAARMPAPEKAAEPEQPKHMDRKLLLLKGARS